MANSDDILWFKTHFSAKIDQAIAGTVFDVDMLTAIACQESGELWAVMRKKNLPLEKIVALCCGDTLDADKGRSAFPRTKAELLAAPNGQAMFDIARNALLEMAKQVPGYEFANTKAHKFCHGYGVFQYDLQFFLENPSYFLQRKYEIFENTLERALGELKNGLRKLRLQNNTSITDAEFCKVAICYNTGGYDPQRGLKQGHKSDGKYYGEFIRDYLVMARRVATPGGGANAGGAVNPAAAGTANPPPAEALTASGTSFRVETSISTLRLRGEPRIPVPAEANIVAEMPDGQIVKAVSDTPRNGFLEVETVLGGKVFRGFASRKYLVEISHKAASAAIEESRVPEAFPKIPQVFLSPPPGLVTKRTAVATAHSLNEPNMPGRTASDPAGLRAELAQIIAYLDLEDSRHKRYWPRDGLTFCNIYAHDFCTLAGAYLPRVWWNGPALMKIAHGAKPAPKIGSTVDEVRANDLFRWLRDFGEQFGWRRAGSPTELQDHANLGGMGIIVARRKEDGRSGHIVLVVPETADETAKRDASGEVTMPLQSQAGSVNFRYNRSTLDWWKSDRFAESAFWLHN